MQKRKQYSSTYFNPRTPCGVRLLLRLAKSLLLNFNPRTPCGVRLGIVLPAQLAHAFQSTHPLRGATLRRGTSERLQCISIHAPLAGCDSLGGLGGLGSLDFNPRTPCGVRLVVGEKPGSEKLFQSTHPLRGATLPGLCSCLVWRISIHAPLAGCDLTDCIPPTDFKNFNPRTPCGVRHQRQHRQKRRYRISIHAPLAGCDTSCAAEKRPSGPFQSTHPLRGATRLGGCRARAV